MEKNDTRQKSLTPKWLTALLCLLMIGGMGIFMVNLVAGDRAKAWQAYLVNFLLFSAIAHGAVLFSALMHAVRARWSGPLSDLAEAFSAFFPVSFFLLLLLYFGKGYVFPWMYHDLHGKEAWLNLPFLISRDAVALLVLYGFGFAYLYHALYFKISDRGAGGMIGKRLRQRWQANPPDVDRFRRRTTRFAMLYMLAFALVLSLLGYDLVMGADPHWYSTLFGAYSFVKAIYVGFGALIITAAVLHMSRANSFQLRSSQFHDIGKLFFGFCLVWADFFYAQFVVIWYGNISEETSYIIERTMAAPWANLAWAVFGICFIGPFLILINKKIKTMPMAMTVICSLVIIGMWLEHFLLLAPALYPDTHSLPLSWIDLGVGLGFLGLLTAAVTLYVEQFPELLHVRVEEGR
jgi:Ni/Fe-hydrogenase subunit HybB-like protein